MGAKVESHSSGLCGFGALFLKATYKWLMRLKGLINVDGVITLLKQVDHYKASGPNGISSKMTTKRDCQQIVYTVQIAA